MHAWRASTSISISTYFSSTEHVRRAGLAAVAFGYTFGCVASFHVCMSRQSAPALTSRKSAFPRGILHRGAIVVDAKTLLLRDTSK